MRNKQGVERRFVRRLETMGYAVSLTPRRPATCPERNFHPSRPRWSDGSDRRIVSHYDVARNGPAFSAMMLRRGRRSAWESTISRGPAWVTHRRAFHTAVGRAGSRDQGPTCAAPGRRCRPAHRYSSHPDCSRPALTNCLLSHCLHRLLPPPLRCRVTAYSMAHNPTIPVSDQR
jgi:hypothetical protein